MKKVGTKGIKGLSMGSRGAGTLRCDKDNKISSLGIFVGLEQSNSLATGICLLSGGVGILKVQLSLRGFGNS